MTREEAVRAIQSRLGFRKTLAEEIRDALKQSQVDAEQDDFLPWFLRSEISSISTTVNEERVPVPQNFIREWDEDALYWYDENATKESWKWRPLKKKGLEWLRWRYPGSAEPRGYALTNPYFRILPVPDDAYQLKMIYYKHDDVLDSDIENAWLKFASEFIMGRAGLMLSGTRDRDAMTAFQRMETRGRNRMIVGSVARQEEGRRRFMGELED